MSTLSELITTCDDIPSLQQNISSYPGSSRLAGVPQGLSTHLKNMEESPNPEGISQLKQLVLANEDEPSPIQAQTSSVHPNKQCLEELLASGPLPTTNLGRAVENLYEAWSRLLLEMSASTGFTNPTLEHIKETAECGIRQLKDSCDDLCGEFTKVSLSWRLNHLEEAAHEDIEDLERAILRQEALLTRATGTLQRCLANMNDNRPI